MVRRHPDEYKFPLWGNIALYSTLLAAHYMSVPRQLLFHCNHTHTACSFDTSMAQKSHFKMQMQGTYQERNTFPQWPWATIKEPKYIQTAHGCGRVSLKLGVTIADCLPAETSS